MNKITAKKILKACKAIKEADERCIRHDGPVGPTSSEMSKKDNQLCYSIVWRMRHAAKRVMEGEGDE